MNPNHSEILVIIMAATGIIGGFANFAMLSAEEKADAGEFVIAKSILIGLCASFLVPLFLTTISSNILEPANSTATFPEKNYFIFSGFCLLAAILSKRFILDLYARVVKAEKVAKEAKVEATDARQTAVRLENEQTEPLEAAPESSLLSLESSSEEGKVLKAITGSKYTYRSLSGIQRETGIEMEKLKAILTKLVEIGALSSRKSRKGYQVWIKR